MKNRNIAALAGMLLSSAAYAQQPPMQDTLLDHMTGRWVLQGSVAGKETTHDVEAVWVLNHHYVRIHEVSREKNAHGQPAYEAEVYIGWDQAAGEYVCLWIDVWGGAGPGTIGRAASGRHEIAFLFRDANNAVDFHTTFVYNASERLWSWVMDNDTGGKLSPFARLTMTPAQ